MTPDDLIDMKRLLMILRRQIRLIGACIAGCLFLALVVLMFSTARYTAQASLLLDRSITAAISEISPIKQMVFETSSINSEVEIIHSYSVAAQAVKRLKTQGYFPDAGDTPAEIKALSDNLLSGLRVGRVGETYVLSISATSGDPQKAADIANAFAESYITNQLDTSSEMSARTASWLQDKIGEIKAQAAQARKAIYNYRTAYNKQRRTREDGSEEQIETPETPEMDLGTLRTLEQEASTYDTLYDYYLEKLKSINMQETFPLTETRIISHAAPPKSKSHPKAFLILGIALIFGTGCGALAALVRESFDKTLKRAGQVQNGLHLPFLGFLPLRQHMAMARTGFRAANGTTLDISLYNDSVANPSSLAAETIRTLLNAADRLDVTGARVVGITSADKASGKTALAANLALLCARSTPTLLIDADLREDGMAFHIQGQDSIKTLQHVLEGSATLQESVVTQQDGALSILPAFAKDLDATLPYLSAAQAKTLVDAARAQYGMIIINLPSLMLPAEMYSFAATTDGIALVATWGMAEPNMLNFYLKQNDINPQGLLGVVLENADMSKMEKFYGHKGYA